MNFILSKIRNISNFFSKIGLKATHKKFNKKQRQNEINKLTKLIESNLPRKIAANNPKITLNTVTIPL